MVLSIPASFSKKRSQIKKLYRQNETYRSIYDDYLKCIDVLHFWQASNAENAVYRQNEYSDLILALEEELKEIMNKEVNDSL